MRAARKPKATSQPAWTPASVTFTARHDHRPCSPGVVTATSACTFWVGAHCYRSPGALRTRAGLRRGETVLINGATGTTGQVAVQIAKHLGAERVIATGRSSDALARLVELGADATVDLTATADAVRDALAEHFADGGVDVVLDYLSGPPTETVLAALASSHKAAGPVRYVIAGTSAGASTSVPTSVLGSTPIMLMGAGIGAVRVPDIIQASAEALQIAGSANVQIDVAEVPLAQVAQAWTADHGRSRVVFTV